MKAKCLKHKTLEGVFGHYVDDLGKGRMEIYHGHIPVLQPVTADIESMKTMAKAEGEKLLLEQLEDYDLVEVNIQMPHPETTENEMFLFNVKEADVKDWENPNQAWPGFEMGYLRAGETAYDTKEAPLPGYKPIFGRIIKPKK